MKNKTDIWREKKIIENETMKKYRKIYSLIIIQLMGFNSIDFENQKISARFK